MAKKQKTQTIAQEAAWAAFLGRLHELYDAGKGETLEKLGAMVGSNRNVVWEWMFKGKGGKRVAYEIMRDRLRGVGLNPSDFFDTGSDDSEYTKVPWLEATASMGGGSIETSKSANAHLAFRTDWLRPHGRLSGMVVVNASGDSMSPTIPDRAVVLVNETDKVPVNNAIFFVCYGNAPESHIYLKRLRVKSGKVTHLISDVDGYEMPLKPGEYFEIIGRALWYGKEL